MIVAVVSGKGGTGKTTVATALAREWSRTGPLVLADCDVEGPNAHHFLPDLELVRSHPVEVAIPVIDSEFCQLCGACAGFCGYGALAKLPDRILFIQSECHSCGGCAIVCPNHAIGEDRRAVGEITVSVRESLYFLQGRLNIGESRATPVIEAVLSAAIAHQMRGADVLIDGPPGASCPASAVVAAADICLMVTEPTPFGLHDLSQIRELILARGKPMAVILNRASGEVSDAEIEARCRAWGIPLLLRIPNDRAIAESYAAGRPPLAAWQDHSRALAGLRESLRAIATTSKLEEIG